MPRRRRRAGPVSAVLTLAQLNSPELPALLKPLPLLPPAAMPRCAAAGSRRGAEFGARLARVGGLEDFAAGIRARVVARGFAAGAVGQGFRAVHFVEMGFVDF
jgi:hypothetical protein